MSLPLFWIRFEQTLMYTLKHIHTQYQNVHLSLALLNLTLIAADSDCLSPHTQYCNGGDLADYLQGKHHTNLFATHTHTHALTDCSSKQSY